MTILVIDDDSLDSFRYVGFKEKYPDVIHTPTLLSSKFLAHEQRALYQLSRKHFPLIVIGYFLRDDPFNGRNVIELIRQGRIRIKSEETFLDYTLDINPQNKTSYVIGHSKTWNQSVNIENLDLDAITKDGNDPKSLFEEIEKALLTVKF